MERGGKGSEEWGGTREACPHESLPLHHCQWRFHNDLNIPNVRAKAVRVIASRTSFNFEDQWISIV